MKQPKRVGGQVEYELWERLVAVAQELELSLAWIIRRALAEWLERYEGERKG